MDRCAACGRPGGDLKKCSACKSVKYCSVGCQKSHRPLHKKMCRRIAAELFDDELFPIDPLPREECPICLLPMPIPNADILYKACCGKLLCGGCCFAQFDRTDMRGDSRLLSCPFCSSPGVPDKENLERVQKRAEMNDPHAVQVLACAHADGYLGADEDLHKALELWHRAAELGNPDGYYNIANEYTLGRIVEEDEKKALHYYELAAKGGHILARNSAGCLRAKSGDMTRAYKHFIIGAKAGCDAALKNVRQGFECGDIKKEGFDETLRAHKKSQDAMKSDMRDKSRRHLVSDRKDGQREAAEQFDKILFQTPPPGEECPICCLTMPLEESQVAYLSCCVKNICKACLFAHAAHAQPGSPCPFCRAPVPTYAENFDRLKKRMEVNDGEAYHQLASAYQAGAPGVTRDPNKAMELWLKGAELGSITSQFNLGNHYYFGTTCEKNVERAKHYYQQAAIAGHVKARHNVGNIELELGNPSRASKHWMISASAGHDGSLHNLRGSFMNGLVGKADYEAALRAHQKSKDAMKRHGERATSPGDYAASIRAIWGPGNHIGGSM